MSRVQIYDTGRQMSLDKATIKNLELTETLFEKKNFGDNKLYMPLTADKIDAAGAALANMRIPYLYGGTNVGDSVDSLRVKELRNEDLLAGDILVWLKDAVSAPVVAVHNGKEFVCAENGQLVPMGQFELDHFIKYRWFIGLRPTQSI